MEVILFQPEIPQNTGNIIRTCSVTGTSLVLVRPLGFSLASRLLKRSGLDYTTDIRAVDSLEECLSPPFYFFSSKASTAYTEITFEKNAQIIFGSESSGLPHHLHEKWKQNFFSIPMLTDSRCLNLSNAVSIILYEAWRQLSFCFSKHTVS